MMLQGAVARITGAVAATSSPLVGVVPTPRAASSTLGVRWLAAAGLLLAGATAVSSKDQLHTRAEQQQEEEAPTPGMCTAVCAITSVEYL